MLEAKDERLHQVDERRKVQYALTTASEQQVIAWLASTPEPADISKIPENLQLSPPELLKVIQSLGRRSLVETVKQNGRSHFTIEPVIREYIINKTRNKN